jgi:TolB-like protein/tetratricopeptide (TPR) repeat protein
LPDHPIAESSLPSPEAVRQQLQAILGSRPFVTATRARRFLTYIVEQTLAGETDGIKELVLGTEVFDRPADFDPKVDTIVRVEAGKLRKRLEEYYADEGAATPLRIEVPKGGYVPQFVVAAQPSAPEASAPAAAPRRRFAAGVLALLLISGCAWGVWRFRAPAAPVSPSIAVLPFLNLSADPANEYFTDGLAEELTDALCNAGGLRVASRTSAFFFKGKQADAREIGAKLHVAFVVEGSVRKQGDQLKVTAQLIRTDDGYHAWSGSFERKLSDVFAVQQELAGSLVNALQVKLTGTQSRRLKKTHTASPQAFDLYLQGKHVSNSYGPDSRVRAEQLFRQAIAADPAYALSYAALADLYMHSNILADRPARETVSRANTAIHQALALDDELAEAHAILGSLSARHEYDWATAERHLRHALELNPSSALAHNQLAQNVLAPQGRWQEALAENRLASELDPLSPVIAVSEPWLASLERRHDAAEEGFRKLAAANPGDVFAVLGLAGSLLNKGDYPAAIKTFQQVQSLVPPTLTLGRMGYAQARTGNAAAARAILRQVQSLEESGRYVPPDCFATLYIGLGDNDLAFRYLEMAREQQESFVIFARVGGIFDPIRQDPRFPVLLSELGLSDEQVQKNQSHR